MNNIRAVILFCMTCIMVPSSFAAEEYKITSYPKEATEDREVSFMVSSKLPITVLPEPEHPRIVWLSSNVRNKLFAKNYEATFKFIPKGTGNITPPPLPIQIGQHRILLRLDKIKVLPNKSKASSKMVVLWNGKPEKPTSLLVGETVNLDIIAIAPFGIRQQRYLAPSMRIDPVRWYLNTNQVNGYSEQAKFVLFGYKYYELKSMKHEGKQSQIYRYKTRFTVKRTELLKGKIAMTLKQLDAPFTHLTSFKIPVFAMPEQPKGSHLETGLIGDCKFEASMEPEAPESGEPFTITLNMEVKGDPSIMLDLDFSRRGFKNVSAKLEESKHSNFDVYRGTFKQTLIADGSVGQFPEVNLLHYSIPDKSWTTTKILDSAAMKNFTPSTPSTPNHLKIKGLGETLKRPILLNLKPYIFGIIALAPFLPLLVGGMYKLMSKRDVERAKKNRELKSLLNSLENVRDEDLSPWMDKEMNPVLQKYCELSQAASTKEIAEKLAESGHAEFAKILTEHNDAAFVKEKKSPVTKSALLKLLSQLSLIVMFFLSVDSTFANTTEDLMLQAEQDFQAGRYESAVTQYESLLIEKPNQANIHYNIATALFANDQLHKARASAHTAVLLDPFSSDVKDLLKTIHLQLGTQSNPGSDFLKWRPDQLVITATVFWVLAFVAVCLRRFTGKKIILTSVAGLFFIITLSLAGLAFLRNSTAYAADQYMVVVEELPRESSPNQAYYDYPPLKSGMIIKASKSTGDPLNGQSDHILVETMEEAFWLPKSKIQKIW